MQEKTRIQVDFNAKQMEDLAALMRSTGVSTKKELLNNALTLLDWAVHEREDNRVIASFDKDDESYRELVMPALSNVRQRERV